MNITFGLLFGTGGYTNYAIDESVSLSSINDGSVELSGTGEKVAYIKRHDTLPGLGVTLKTYDGTPINLTDATVLLTLKSASSNAILFDKPCQIIDAEAGTLIYLWGSTDTNTSGEYFAEFEITNASGKLTVPTIEIFTVVIIDDLNDV